MCLETNNIIKKMECLKLDIVADTQQRKQEEEHEHQQEQEEQHFHVLAVDDNLIERKLLEKLLKVSSYKVTCVHSGDEALKYLGLHDDLDQNSLPSSSFSSPSPILEGSKVNLIMTDYCMPGISGYDLLKRVKGSSWKDVPVVIMSSENVPSRISKCLEGGAEEFLLKPLQLSDLKNLEHYLLKPTPTMDDDFSASDDSNNEDDNKTDDAEDNKSNNNNMISKRKAASPGPSERLPKVKGVAVV